MSYLYDRLPRIDASSVEEALRYLNCDFTAVQQPLSYEYNGSTLVVPHHKAVIASDDGSCLGINSNRYGILQYKKTLSFMNALLAEEGRHKLTIERGASTYNRARIYLVLRSEEEYQLNDVEKVLNYFVVSTTHDGSGNLTILNTPVHAADNRQLRSVITPMGKGLIKIRHSANVQDILQRTRSVMEKIYAEWQENVNTFRLLANHKVSDEEARVQFFEKVVEGDSSRAQNAREKMFDLYKIVGAGSRIPSCQGTIFGCYIAVVQYVDQFKTVRKSSKGLSELEARVEASLNGAACADKAKAYSLAKRLAMGAKMFAVADKQREAAGK